MDKNINAHRLFKAKNGSSPAQENDAPYRFLFEACTDPIVIYDGVGCVTQVNPAFEQIFGWTAAEVIGKPLDFTPEENRAQARALTERLRREGRVELVDTRRLTKDGRVLNIQWSASIMRNGGGGGGGIIDTGGITGILTILHPITRYEEVEAALQETQQRVTDIINFLPDAMVVIDTQGKVIAWNHAMEEMTGVKAADMLGKGDYEYALPFYGERRPILVDLVLMPRAEFDKKYTHIQRIGDTLFGESYTPNLKSGAYHLSAMASPLRDRSGSLVGAIETIRDNTERRKMETALQESQRRMADIINFLPDATLVIDSAGKVIAWNHAIEEMTGVKAADMLGKGNYEYSMPFYGERRPILVDLVQVPSDELEKRYAHIHRIGETLSGESYTPHVKSGALYLYATASPLHDSHNNVVGAIETIRDITERKENQETMARLYREMEREKQYLESLIRNSPVAIIVVDLRNVITTWNPAAESLFGYTQGEALNHNVDELITTPAMQAEAHRYSLQTTSGSLIHVITQRARKDKTLVDVELLGVPVIVAGQSVGSVAMYHDITELQRARRSAEAATQAKSEFLANMSHEIRTPMNGVIGMTSLLLDTNLDHEQKEYAQTIRKSGDALLSIINDILDFSKIEAGKLELEVQPFELRECVETAVDLVAYRVSEQGVELLTNIELDVPQAVIGDVTRVRQILANLLSNAAKFTEAGEIEVAVKKEPGSKPGDQDCRLHFSVRDTGVGIPPTALTVFSSCSRRWMPPPRADLAAPGWGWPSANAWPN